MHNNIIIRRLTIDDLTTFVILRLEALQRSPTSFSSSYEEEKDSAFQFFENIFKQNHDDNVIFGAFFSKTLVGMIGIYREKQVKAQHKCNIWGVYVQPEYRKKGIGKLLLTAVIEYASKQLTCSILKLSVEKNNWTAKKLYESFGFKAWGEEPNAVCFQEEFHDELHMTLIVKPGVNMIASNQKLAQALTSYKRTLWSVAKGGILGGASGGVISLGIQSTWLKNLLQMIYTELSKVITENHTGASNFSMGFGLMLACALIGATIGFFYGHQQSVYKKRY